MVQCWSSGRKLLDEPQQRDKPQLERVPTPAPIRVHEVRGHLPMPMWRAKAMQIGTHQQPPRQRGLRGRGMSLPCAGLHDRDGPRRNRARPEG